MNFRWKSRSDSMLCGSSETEKLIAIRGITKGDNSERTLALPKRNRVLNPKNDRMENWTNQQKMIHNIRMSRISYSSQEMEEFQTGLICNPYR